MNILELKTSNRKGRGSASLDCHFLSFSFFNTINTCHSFIEHISLSINSIGGGFSVPSVHIPSDNQ